MKRIMSIILIISFLLVPVSILSACGKEALGAAYKPGTPTSYVTLSYNPSVELVADEKHKVIAINAVNDEAGLLFYAKDYRGYPVDVVIREMVKVMVQTGYMVADSEENADAVFVSVHSTESAIKQEVFTKIKLATENFFIANGQYAIVTETKFDSKITGYASLNNVSDYARFRLVLKAMEYDVDLEFTDAMNLNNTKLLAKIYEELKLMSQIKTKAQKESYLTERTTLKQTLRDDLKVIYNNPTYTSLYDELEALRQEYRTTNDLSYANNTIKPQIVEKEKEVYPLEKTLRTQKISQVLNREETYKQEKLDLLYEKVQLSLENQMDYLAQLLQKKEEFKEAYEARFNYAKSNSYLWQTEYEAWKPMTTTEVTTFLETIETKANSIRVSTRTEVARAINRINPYTRSFGFGDSSGTVVTFP